MRDWDWAGLCPVDKSDGLRGWAGLGPVDKSDGLGWLGLANRIEGAGGWAHRSVRPIVLELFPFV